MLGVDTRISVNGSRILHGLGVDYAALDKELKKAMRRALNETLTRTRAAGVRRMNTYYDLNVAGKVRVGAYIQRSWAKKGEVFLSGSVLFKGSVGLPLSYFAIWPRTMPNYKGVNPRRRRPKGGFRVRIKRGESRRVVEGSFLVPAQSKSARRNGLLFELVTRKENRGAVSERQERFFKEAGINKFNRPMGPSPIQALASIEGEAFLRDYMETTFAKRAEHQLTRMFK